MDASDITPDENARHSLDGSLCGGIDAVGRLEQSDDARREVDDAPTGANAPRGFTEGVERAFEIHVHLPIESRVVGFDDGRQRHDASVVDQYVHAAERGFRRIEHAAHGLRVAHVGLGGQRSAALAFDRARQSLGRRGVA
jgi:hypothetical protein